jgi:hypothetical protein
MPGTTWANEEYVLKLNSSEGANDGSLQILKDNSLKLTTSTWQPDDATRPGHINNIFIEHDPSNMTANGNVWFDDIYIDASWNAVKICNASSYSSSTYCEMQVPTAWADGEIKFEFSPSNFSTGESVYVYVFDGDNVQNNAGYSLSIGSGPNKISFSNVNLRNITSR